MAAQHACLHANVPHLHPGGAGTRTLCNRVRCMCGAARSAARELPRGSAVDMVGSCAGARMRARLACSTGRAPFPGVKKQTRVCSPRVHRDTRREAGMGAWHGGLSEAVLCAADRRTQGGGRVARATLRWVPLLGRRSPARRHRRRRRCALAAARAAATRRPRRRRRCWRALQPCRSTPAPRRRRRRRASPLRVPLQARRLHGG